MTNDNPCLGEYKRSDDGIYDKLNACDLNECDTTNALDCLFSEVENIKSEIQHLNDKISTFESYAKIEDRIATARDVLEKFEDHLKNINRLNQMINELKGSLSIVRAAMLKTEKCQASLRGRYEKAMKILFKGMKETDSE